MPVVIGDRVQVCAPWCAVDRTTGPPVVEIDPSTAFGTGSHPSTRLLLGVIAERLEPGCSMLDVGCGSGVLAVVAARLGAGRVAAIDIDPAAVAATKANAARNGMTVDACHVPLVEVMETFDVVVANIDADTLRSLGPSLRRPVACGGWLAVSGISPAQTDRVAAALSASGDHVEEVIEGEWAAVIVNSPAGQTS